MLASACGGGATTAPSSAPAASSAAAATATPKPSPFKLMVSFSNVIGDELPLWSTKEGGFFEQNALEVGELQSIASAQGVPALIAGQIQVAQVGGSEILSANAEGADLVVVAQIAGVYPFVLSVAPEIKTAADLKGKRLSAAGGGVGSFNWVMGREVLKTAGLTVDDVQFISQGTAGRLPGLVSGQLDGVALHPEDVFLAQNQKPGVHVLVTLSDLVPLYYFNAYGVSDDFLAKDRVLVRDAVASLMEANRAIYQDKAKVVPIMMQATEKPQDAVEFAYDFLTKGCIWSVNTGYKPERTAWTIDLAIANGDIPPDKKPPYEQVVDKSLGEEALAQVGGTTTINGCSD